MVQEELKDIYEDNVIYAHMQPIRNDLRINLRVDPVVDPGVDPEVDPGVDPGVVQF